MAKTKAFHQALIGRLVRPLNVLEWWGAGGLKEPESKPLVGKVAAVRIGEYGNERETLLLTIELHDGRLLDRIPVGRCAVIEEGAHLMGARSYLVKVDHSQKTNRRYLVVSFDPSKVSDENGAVEVREGLD